MCPPSSGSSGTRLMSPRKMLTRARMNSTPAQPTSSPIWPPRLTMPTTETGRSSLAETDEDDELPEDDEDEVPLAAGGVDPAGASSSFTFFTCENRLPMPLGEKSRPMP